MRNESKMKNSSVEKINKININPERIKDSDISVLWITAATGENKSTLTFRDHTHAFYEIHLILEGEVIYGIGEETVNVTEGHLFIIEPRLSHRVVDHSNNFFKITVAVSAVDGTDIFAISSNRGFTLASIKKEIESSISFIAESGKSYGKYSDDIIESRLKEIVYIIADTVSGPIQKREDEYDSRIYRAKKYIEDNPSCFFTYADIASFCRLSEKQISRLFMKHEGISLLSYIHTKKLELAKKLLTESDEPQESIAISLGFSSVHYFNKFFIKHTSVSPGEYRKHSKA